MILLILASFPTRSEYTQDRFIWFMINSCEWNWSTMFFLFFFFFFLGEQPARNWSNSQRLDGNNCVSPEHPVCVSKLVGTLRSVQSGLQYNRRTLIYLQLQLSRAEPSNLMYYSMTQWCSCLELEWNVNTDTYLILLLQQRSWIYLRIKNT